MKTQTIQKSRSHHDATAVLTLKGLIGTGSGCELRDNLLGAVRSAQTVIIDFTGADVRDSSILACLVEGLQIARKRGVDFFLTSLSEEAERILVLFRLHRVFKVVDRTAQA